MVDTHGDPTLLSRWDDQPGTRETRSLDLEAKSLVIGIKCVALFHVIHIVHHNNFRCSHKM